MPKQPGPPLRLSAREARWAVLAAQGLAAPRPAKPVRRADLLALVRRLGHLQVDAINVVERTHLVVPFSRLGAYDRDLLHGLLAPGSPLFEFWAHAACFIPVEHHPFLRWRMGGGHLTERSKYYAVVTKWKADHAEYMDALLAEVAASGPLRAGELEDPRRRDGEWWGRRSVGRQALEMLAGDGHLVGSRTPSFEKVYDVPERALPPEVLATPTPGRHECLKALLLVAARAYGVASAKELAEHHYLPKPECVPLVRELAAEGALVQIEVEGWTEPAYAPAGFKRPRPPARTTATLLSPFDQLIADRARLARLFGFDYKIEVYVPEPKRVFGYYVFPLLLGDALVARLDLKADRKAGVLRVVAAHPEPGVDEEAVGAAALAELGDMASWLGLSGVELTGRGALSPALAAATA